MHINNTVDPSIKLSELFTKYIKVDILLFSIFFGTFMDFYKIFKRSLILILSALAAKQSTAERENSNEAELNTSYLLNVDKSLCHNGSLANALGCSYVASTPKQQAWSLQCSSSAVPTYLQHEYNDYCKNKSSDDQIGLVIGSNDDSMDSFAVLWTNPSLNLFTNLTESIVPQVNGSAIPKNTTLVPTAAVNNTLSINTNSNMVTLEYMQNSIVPVAKDDKVQIAGIFRAHFNETEGNFAFIAYNNNPAIQFVELSSANSGFVLDDNQTHHSKIRTTHRMPTVSEINDFSCSAKPPYTVHSLACVFTATLKNGDMAVCAFVQPLLDQNAEQGARDNLSLVCGNATGIIDGNDHIAHVSSFPNAIQGMQKGDTFIPNDRFYNNILVVLHRYLEDQNLSLFSLLGIDQYTGSLLFNLHLNNDTSSYQWIPLFCGNTNENLISELIDTSNTSSVSSVKLKISGVGLVKGAREIIIPKDRLILSKNGNAIILRTNSSNIVESLNCLPSSNPYYSFFVIPALALLSLSLYGAYKYKTKNNDQNISLLETVVEHLTPCMNKNSTSISNNTNKRLDCNKPKYHCDNVTSIHYQPVPSTTVLKLSKACIISNDHFHKIKLHYLGADEYSVYGLNVETKHPEDKIPLPVDLIKALSKKQRKLFSETLQKYISEHGSTDDHYQEASRLATKEIISETGEDSVYVDIVAEPAPNTSTFQYEHGSADDHYQEASTKDVVAEPAPNTSTFQYEHGSTDDHYQEASRLATKEIICETGEDSVDASIIAESAPNTSTFQSNASIHPSFGRAAVTSL